MFFKLETDTEKKDNRVIRFTGSTESVNDHGHIVRQDGADLERYKKNPVFIWAHDYRGLPLGRSNKTQIINKKMVFDIEFIEKKSDPFSEFADHIYGLYRDDFLKAVSIGFNVQKYNFEPEQSDIDRGAYAVIEKWELYELSGVLMGSDPDAIKNAIKNGTMSTSQLSTIMNYKFSPSDISKKTNSEIDLKKMASMIAYELQSIQELQAAKEKQKNRYSWLDDGLKTLNNSLKGAYNGTN